MTRNDYLAGPAYAVAFMLVFIPLFDAMTSALPANFASEQWRFGVIGLLSNAFMLPAAGLLIAFAAAATRGHRKTLRVFGWLCGFAAVLTFALLLLFALDAVQTRLNVQPQARLAFAFASFTAAAKLVMAIVTLMLMSRTGLRSRTEAQRSAAPATTAAGVNSRLLVSY